MLWTKVTLPLEGLNFWSLGPGHLNIDPSSPLLFQVQESVANCLPPLVPAIKADAPDLVHKLLRLLLESGDYGERRGAAYGLAGLVKGLGILSLKQLDIMSTLQEAIQNKKNSVHREGESGETLVSVPLKEILCRY